MVYNNSFKIGQFEIIYNKYYQKTIIIFKLKLIRQDKSWYILKQKGFFKLDSFTVNVLYLRFF